MFLLLHPCFQLVLLLANTLADTAKAASLSVPQKLLRSWGGDGAALRAGFCPAGLSHPWTLLVLRPFLGKSPKTLAKGEQKIVSKVQSLSWCSSFCLGYVTACKRQRSGDPAAPRKVKRCLRIHFPLLQHQEGIWESVPKRGGAWVGVVPPQEPIYHLCVLVFIF